MRNTSIFFFSLICTSFAQDLPNEKQLDPITITATRFAELISDVPHSVDVIEERDILEDTPRGFHRYLHQIQEFKYRKQLTERDHHLLEALLALEISF